MLWIVPLIAVLVLAGFLIYFLTIKDKPKEMRGLILLTLSLLVYHIGDTLLWAGWNYEVARRIASVGFYFEIPFILLLMYYLVPKEKMNLFIRIFTGVLMLPWLVALILVYKWPIVYLGEPDPQNETIIYALIICFIIAIIFAVIVGFRAAKFRSDAFGKKLARYFSITSIVLVVLYLFLWSTIETIDYDATWLFGVVSIFYVVFLWLGSCICKEVIATPEK
jgi:hypothetical protein